MVWHLDKGFPATLKKAFVNPGKESRDYLAGKRVGWFSILTMILILYAVAAFLTPSPEVEYNSEGSKRILEFLRHNVKWLLLGLCFICSLSSLLLFRRAKLNLSEHTIINCFFLIGLLTISIVAFAIPYYFSDWLYFIAIAAYLLYSYYGAFRRHYTIGGFAWRIATHAILTIFISSLLLVGGILAAKRIMGDKTSDFIIEAKDLDSTSKHAPTTPRPSGH